MKKYVYPFLCPIVLIFISIYVTLIENFVIVYYRSTVPVDIEFGIR